MKLTKTLYEYADKQYISFHTPGHKGKFDLSAALDVTELEETDNLFHPTGILLESQKELAASLGCREVIFLPNGATSGNLGVFFALFQEGDKVIVDRNCHISVINALVLTGAMPIFTESIFCDCLPMPAQSDNIEKILNCIQNIKGIFITSPNYYGMLADICSISELAHRFHIPLIVDEAHGAHMYYTSDGEKGALNSGADISIISLHKNLPVLTQCGIISYNDSAFDNIKSGVKYFTSTSPSYLLMSAMDQLAEKMNQTGRQDLKNITDYTINIRKKIQQIENISLIETSNYDPTRIVISINECNISTETFAQYLKTEHHIVCEMIDSIHIVFIVTLCNTMEELERLYGALSEAARKFGKCERKMREIAPFSSQMKMMPKTAHYAIKEEIPLSTAVGRIAGENIICFPPSVPICVLGEQLTEQTIENIRHFAGRERILAVKTGE